MSKQHCHNFTSCVLGNSQKRYDDKVSNLYDKYDDDKDDFLKF